MFISVICCTLAHDVLLLGVTTVKAAKRAKKQGAGVKFSHVVKENNLQDSENNSTFAQPDKQELAVAYSDFFRKQASGKFRDGIGYAFSANFFHLLKMGKSYNHIKSKEMKI